MGRGRWVIIALGLMLVGLTAFRLSAQIPQNEGGGQMRHDAGQSVTPAFEGWYPNPDGTFSLSFGYMNRNYKEEPDIPIGPNNKIEPGPADQGQPTHFQTRRRHGMFAVIVPKDFGTKQVTWTLTSGGHTYAIPGHLLPDYRLDSLRQTTTGNTPPVTRLEAEGTPGSGIHGPTTVRTASMSSPLTLDVWATDDGIRKRGQKPTGVGVVWSKYRGAGKVTFSSPESMVDATGKATTTAKFSQPGEYMVRAHLYDESGIDAGSDVQCCWTNGYVKITVTP